MQQPGAKHDGEHIF